MNPLSPVAFAGKDKRTSYLHKQGQIKKGTVLIQMETRQPTQGQIPQVTLTQKTVVSLKPHRGQKDSADFSVPLAVQSKHDGVDMLTFTDGTTAHVGQYSQPSLDGTQEPETFIIGALSADDTDYSLKHAGNIAYQREFFTIPDALRLLQNQINKLTRSEAILRDQLKNSGSSLF